MKAVDKSINGRQAVFFPEVSAASGDIDKAR